ncbi:hypothetical protein U27_05724 [Candidatus Vecturithrix granuli]|uniref:PilT protein domain protein n=1 Tax=Vecturithrix granuli TaxID=1499967 RepID=A0A081C2E4_VECG1|nr:hypothetical protein U27_05724 [Candidatus Vecturithrix granuli]
MRRLHAGEQDVLNVALELHADMLILDDKKARNEAKALGFDVYYTSAILKGAEKRGLIVSAAQLIAELRKMDIYLPVV